MGQNGKRAAMAGIRQKAKVKSKKLVTWQCDNVAPACRQTGNAAMW